MSREIIPKRVFSSGQEFWIDESGIIRTAMIEGMHVTLEDAQAHMQDALKITGGEKFPVLVDLRKIKSMDRGARALYAGSNTTRIEKAVAILIGSPVSRIIGNFFIGLNRSSVPTRIFTSETEAIEWLKEYCA